VAHRPVSRRPRHAAGFGRFCLPLGCPEEESTTEETTDLLLDPRKLQQIRPVVGREAKKAKDAQVPIRLAKTGVRIE
jgi:hypothetical protein